MSVSDFGSRYSPNAETIRQRLFATVRRGFDPNQVLAYQEEVASLVESLEAQLKQAKAQADALAQATTLPRSEVAPVEGREDPYEALSTRMADLIRAADQQAEKVLRESEEQAEKSVTEAEERAEQRLRDATQQAERLVREAEDQAQHVTTEAEAKAHRVTTESEEKAERLTSDAQAEADRIRVDAQAKAEDARAVADRILARLQERKDSFLKEIRPLQERLLEMAKELESTLATRGAEEAIPREGAAPSEDHETWLRRLEEEAKAQAEGRIVVLPEVEAGSEAESSRPDPSAPSEGSLRARETKS